jgi:hypothetical protein
LVELDRCGSHISAPTTPFTWPLVWNVESMGQICWYLSTFLDQSSAGRSRLVLLFLAFVSLIFTLVLGGLENDAVPRICTLRNPSHCSRVLRIREAQICW